MDEAEDEGQYFHGPNSGKQNDAGNAPRSRGGGDANGIGNGNSLHNGFKDVKLQDEVEEDEEDPMAEIKAYQEQLRTQDTARAVNSGQLAAMSNGVAETFGVEEEEEPNDEIPEEDSVQAYQLQLRNKDEADAVAGLAVGNLTDIVATRTAPKSHDALNEAVNNAANFPASRQSALGHLEDESFEGFAPESCTCAAGSAELCAYCLMLNGPASNNSSTTFSPNSSATPSMPASFSSMVGMPSQQSGRPTSGSQPQSSAVAIANGMSPGWSEQQPILVPDESAHADARAIATKATPAVSAVANKAVSGTGKLKKKKSGGLFACCFRPKLPEDDEIEQSQQTLLQQPNSLTRNLPSAVSAGGPEDSAIADELVEDGVPMGGVTATSEDVMQLDGNDVLIQCNVGLSVDDPNARAYSGPPPAHNLNLNVDKGPASSQSISPMSTGLSQPPTAGAAPLSWGPLPSEMAQQQQNGSSPLSPSSAGQSPLGLTEANLAQHAPASRSGRRPAPTSGTSLFSVAEHAAAITVGAPAPPSGAVGLGKQGAGQAAPMSASLQELQGLDDRRNMYLQSLAAKKEKSTAPPISNTLLELQNRQVVGETANRFGG